MIHRAVAVAMLLSLGWTTGPLAQSVRLIGDFRDWSAYSASEGAGPLCFAMSKPTEVTPRPDGFTEAHLYLTNRPAEGVRLALNRPLEVLPP